LSSSVNSKPEVSVSIVRQQPSSVTLANPRREVKCSPRATCYEYFSSV
jgi:hypothetical protein